MFTSNERLAIITACGCNMSSVNVLEPLVSMTNRNILFSANDKKYILRRAGEGSNELVNRQNEAQTYNIIAEHHISDKILYINPQNGIKISRYIENTRCCDPHNIHDLKLCMTHLRDFHELKLKTSYTFDLFSMIEYYESLMGKSEYRDYDAVKKKIMSFRQCMPNTSEYVLTHIDPNHNNFLITKSEVYLIDWEYAAMQDPRVDIAMFAIYAGYNKEEVNQLIRIYFRGTQSTQDELMIYRYISICGLLWSNWCEYKKKLGIDFGDYAKSQYLYAKDFI